MKQAKCICKNCNNTGIHPVSVNDRGGRSGFLCNFHYLQNESYYTKNTFRQGKEKSNGFTYSIELETSRSNEKSRVELMNLGYIATKDSTVDVEYKSPIYQGLNSLQKQLLSIDTLINQNNLQINDTCGTHLHVGHTENINTVTMQYIRRFYHSLFVPLSEYMRQHPAKTRQFWGREFSSSGWAVPVNENTDAQNHKNFINTQHDFTLEFRLAKFQNAKQYYNIVCFAKDTVNTIINNFILHFNNDNFDKTRYKNITEYRKHKAKLTAQKILKLYIKYNNE